MELTEKNHNHFTHSSHPGEHNKWTSRQKKNVALNVIKRFCMQARNRPEIFWQT